MGATLLLSLPPEVTMPLFLKTLPLPKQTTNRNLHVMPVDAVST